MMLRYTQMAATTILSAAALSSINAQVVVRPEPPAVPVPVAPAVPAAVPAVIPPAVPAPAVAAPAVPAPAVAVPVQTPVRVESVPATRAADFGLWLDGRANDGLIVTDLAADGVFATAGFREGDRIVSIKGQPVTTEAHVVQYLTGPAIGTEPIPVVVLRGGRQETIVVQPSVITKNIVAYDPLYQYGIVIDDRNLNQIVVRSVFPRTPAYYAGLRAGDVITMVDGPHCAAAHDRGNDARG
jgi:S1-C subfamily serine protease